MSRGYQRYQLMAAVIALAAFGGGIESAAAQATAPNELAVENVTVTGTSIRGVAPVGSNVTTVSEADISALGTSVVQGILASTPQLMGLGSSGNGATGQGAQEASIHQFGNSASTSTLTLVDGHRVPATGTSACQPGKGVLPEYVTAVHAIARSPTQVTTVETAGSGRRGASPRSGRPT